MGNSSTVPLVVPPRTGVLGHDSSGASTAINVFCPNGIVPFFDGYSLCAGRDRREPQDRNDFRGPALKDVDLGFSRT